MPGIARFFVYSNILNFPATEILIGKMVKYYSIEKHKIDSI